VSKNWQHGVLKRQKIRSEKKPQKYYRITALSANNSLLFHTSKNLENQEKMNQDRNIEGEIESKENKRELFPC
jgi:hypothetical protein